MPDPFEEPRAASGFLHGVETGAALLAAVAWLAVALITVVDVLGRAILSAPIFGSYELVKLAMTIGLFVSLPLVVLRGEQIAVRILTSRLPEVSRRGIAVVGALIGAGCFGVVTYALAEATQRNLRYGEVTVLWRIPHWLISGFMGALCGVACLACLVAARRALDKESATDA